MSEADRFYISLAFLFFAHLYVSALAARCQHGVSDGSG